MFLCMNGNHGPAAQSFGHCWAQGRVEQEEEGSWDLQRRRAEGQEGSKVRGQGRVEGVWGGRVLTQAPILCLTHGMTTGRSP